MSKRTNVISAGIFQPILSLTLMCDSVALDPNDPLMAAVVGPGACLLNVDPQALGLTQPQPQRAQLATMVLAALEHAQDSDVLQLMPPVCEGVQAVQLVATFFLYSMETPFQLCIPPPPSPLTRVSLHPLSATASSPTH
jgi:hypothetical protein